MGRKQQAPKAGGLSALHKPGNTTSAFRVLDWGLPGPPASTGRTCEQCRRQILKETLDMVNLPSGSEIAANLFSHALAAARTRQLALEELLGQAEKLKALSQRGLAVELYKSWIAFNPDHKLLHAAYFNYAVELNEAGDRPGAINALRECLRVKQDFYPAYINLGRVLEDSGEIGHAVMQWLALAQTLSAVNGESVKHKVIALKQAGRVLESVHQDAQAEEALRQCIELDLGQTEAIQHWTALRQRQCKWPIVAPLGTCSAQGSDCRDVAPVARQLYRRPDIPAGESTSLQ
jgi:predicted O-linked N-acetylglucosamine transferase (SPINDLY family)